MLKPHVREPIKKEFAELVDLTKKLQSYNEVLVKLEIPETEVFEYDCPYCPGCENEVKVTSMAVNEIGIRTSNPWDLLLFSAKEKEPQERCLTNESKACLFEDIISYTVDLFKKANVEVEVVREHNQKIMEEMSAIVEPWKIANQLKNNKR